MAEFETRGEDKDSTVANPKSWPLVLVMDFFFFLEIVLLIVTALNFVKLINDSVPSSTVLERWWSDTGLSGFVAVLCLAWYLPLAPPMFL